jgi:acetate kinase
LNVLVINCGSSSIKYQLIDVSAERAISAGHVESIPDAGRYAAAVREFTATIANEHRVDAVGHRVVHGGQSFHDACAIDAAVEDGIEACVPLAPLHNPANLAGIRAAREALPDVPHIAVFDTAFHNRMPRRARTYAIDAELAEQHQIRRYGFHGTSHAYVAKRAATYLNEEPRALRLISCHLGNGASACAIEFGQSVDTSMGMTPLEGLVMGTRSGDLDPAIVLELLRDGSRSVDEVARLLNQRGGLLGLSGVSGDLREIEAAAAQGHDRARMAINVFAHRARKYIGAYAAAMGGVDAVILTGGIGENSAAMRRRVLQRLEFLGLVLDENRNSDARVSHADAVAEVSTPHSRVRALVVATNEELMIAREAERIAAGLATVQDPGRIPIAISARHVHLDRAAMDVLFGEGSELTVYREISQPNQFASEQKVDLIGPRDRIDGVRVLGPLRSKPQIEVSRSDEFALGVDAPVRDSGRTEGSAPIVLEGPAGRLELSEGLICAKRHIHMHNDDARRFGVRNGDEVEVAVLGGPRDLVFGDVLIRVSPLYVLEMHIDTDEANAAEISPGHDGDMVYTATAERIGASLRSRRAH